ncbi:TRAFs-binding domain-containing protein [Nocardia terpenica]|uniref:DUF4071 domain-containing protein n=1 Tax=Nocardia terpenica TaxID=455432 RepID=A0A6G9Z2W9_9NOCA|nr:TRAFs-binding domain-containing protein [Nocardia terpenica]QIS19949.1 DUF4071 domain-containing protein [Nocardia terpenica]
MNAPLCFVLMPFRTKSEAGVTVEFDEVYRRILEPAVTAAGLTCLRADEDQVAAVIHKSMFERILLCPFAVADLTMANANVFYELGIRHAVRPWSTILVCARGFRLPFDLMPAPVLRYAIDERGGPVDDDAVRAELITRLTRARADELTDSPLFDLFDTLGAPDTSRLGREGFEARVRATETLQQRLRVARTVAEVARARADVDAAGGSDDAIAIELLMVYRRLRQWQAMVDLIAGFPRHLRGTTLVREQDALARNRLDPGSPAAELALEQLCRDAGPSAETLGLLGRVYKDRWLAAGSSPRGRGLLNKAIATYQRGFETDWRDPYPGINAVHLIWLTDPRDERLGELMPVVEYSTRRRIAGGSDDYWDYATMMELAIYRDDSAAALDWLERALATDPGPMEAESTLHTVLRVRDHRPSPTMAWDILIAALREAAADPPTKDGP